MASRKQFFLKTAPLEGDPPDSPYTNLYVRLHGSGINSVVLTSGPPKFIRAHVEDDGKRVTFTSASHPDRRWGLTLQVDGEQRAGWEKVDIVEDGGTGGLVLEREDGKPDYLVCDDVDGDDKVWKGWMVCPWASGHPQLFWVTDKLEGKLPSFCHRVRLEVEWL